MTKILLNEDQLIQFYKKYCFLEMSEDSKGEACAELELGGGAMTKWQSHTQILIGQELDSSLIWYFVVFKPFDIPYKKDPQWFDHRQLEYCRKCFKKPKVFILTKEREASKIHINALIASNDKIVDGCNTKKHKLSVQQLHTLGDRRRVLAYITKEHSSRPFEVYKDIIYGPKYLCT